MRSLELKTRGEASEKSYVVYYRDGDWWKDKEAMMAWCSKHLGIRNEKFNNPRWRTGPFEFRFKYEKDATMFILRWS